MRQKDVQNAFEKCEWSERVYQQKHTIDFLTNIYQAGKSF